MKEVMKLVMVLEGRFGFGSWEKVDGDIVDIKDEDGEVIELNVIVRDIKEGEVVVGSGDDGVEYAVWCGENLHEKSKKEFVDFYKEMYGKEEDVEKWFDDVLNANEKELVDFY